MIQSKVSVRLLVGLVGLLVSCLVGVSAKCEMSYEDLDNCDVKSSLFGNTKLKIPENENELSEFCE